MSSEYYVFLTYSHVTLYKAVGGMKLEPCAFKNGSFVLHNTVTFNFAHEAFFYAPDKHFYEPNCRSVFTSEAAYGGLVHTTTEYVNALLLGLYLDYLPITKGDTVIFDVEDIDGLVVGNGVDTDILASSFTSFPSSDYVKKAYFFNNVQCLTFTVGALWALYPTKGCLLAYGPLLVSSGSALGYHNLFDTIDFTEAYASLKDKKSVFYGLRETDLDDIIRILTYDYIYGHPSRKSIEFQDRLLDLSSLHYEKYAGEFLMSAKKNAEEVLKTYYPKGAEFVYYPERSYPLFKSLLAKEVSKGGGTTKETEDEIRLFSLAGAYSLMRLKEHEAEWLYPAMRLPKSFHAIITFAGQRYPNTIFLATYLNPLFKKATGHPQFKAVKELFLKSFETKKK